MEHTDENYWRIYGLGEVGHAVETILTKWDIIDSFPDDVQLLRYGMDFGFNHPSVLLKLGYKEDQDIQHLYIQELIYQTRLTNNELIDLMKTVVEDKSIMIKADSAEPDRIMEIARAGFCITACKKGGNSVIEGIDRLKRFHIHITKSSVNTRKEIKGWKFQRDKKTEEVLDKPVEYKDDAMAASRYGSEGIGKKGFMAFAPALLGMLPMPGGALMSAPLLKKAGKGVPAELKAAANVWFRHIMLLVYPLSPSLIASAKIAGIDLYKGVFSLAPFFVLSISLSIVCIITDGCK